MAWHRACDACFPKGHGLDMKQNIPLRILITDRNPRVRRLLCRELEREGFRVLSASGWGDISRAVGEGVDCVIMDLDLPPQGCQGGVALLEQIRRRAPHVPVVVHAFPSGDAAEAAAMSLAAAVVEKDGDTEGLKAAVRRVLASHGERGRGETGRSSGGRAKTHDGGFNSSGNGN